MIAIYPVHKRKIEDVVAWGINLGLCVCQVSLSRICSISLVLRKARLRRSSLAAMASASLFLIGGAPGRNARLTGGCKARFKVSLMGSSWFLSDMGNFYFSKTQTIAFQLAREKKREKEISSSSMSFCAVCERSGYSEYAWEILGVW